MRRTPATKRGAQYFGGVVKKSRHQTFNGYIRDRNLEALKGVFYDKRQKEIRRILRRLNQLPTARVLDVGCGTGALLADIKTSYSKLTVRGIDQQKNKSAPSYITQDDAEKLSSLEGEPPSDLIICVAVMDYVVDKLKAIQRIWEKLKVGGQAFISITPCHFGPHALEMFGELKADEATDDIYWDSDLQALIIKKTHEEPTQLKCYEYEHVPFPSEFVESYMTGPSAKPEFLATFIAYVREQHHSKYNITRSINVPRQRFNRAIQSMYRRKQNIPEQGILEAVASVSLDENTMKGTWKTQGIPETIQQKKLTPAQEDAWRRLHSADQYPSTLLKRNFECLAKDAHNQEPFPRHRQEENNGAGAQETKGAGKTSAPPILTPTGDRFFRPLEKQRQQAQEGLRRKSCFRT